MIFHVEHVSEDRMHVRMYDVDGPDEYAQTLFDQKADFHGCLVVLVKPDHVWVELFSGSHCCCSSEDCHAKSFDISVYSRLRDYLHKETGLEIRWDGNHRTQIPKRRKRNG